MRGTLCDPELDLSLSMTRRSDGERKRALILETALALFREKGFDATTLRDIAERAEISVGSAYHYFPSKEAIVFAYYDAQQDEHEQLAREKLEGAAGLRERLGIVFQSKIDSVAPDRSLLVAIARRLADADDPLSAFSSESREVRERAIALFREAVTVAEVPEGQRDLIARALWALHLALLAYLVNDASRKQSKTRELTDGLLDLLTPLIPMAGLDVLRPIIEQVRTLLTRADLL